jgi:dephospho-CoA kinase
MKIIGLAGTNGSGKDMLGQVLADDYGYIFISVSDILRAEAAKRGLPSNRETLRTISAEWRRKNGLGVLIDMAIEKLKSSSDIYNGLVVSAMRNRGEAEHLKAVGGTLIWIDADPRVRYERVTSRARDAESKMTFEEFMIAERQEMEQSGDEATLGGAKVKELADIYLENSGSIDDFKNLIMTQLKLT